MKNRTGNNVLSFIIIATVLLALPDAMFGAPAENVGSEADRTATARTDPDMPAAVFSAATPADAEEPGITFTIQKHESGSMALYLTEGVAVTEADLLAGVTAADENGEPVCVAVKDVGGLDLDHPQSPMPVYLAPAYLITYEAAHPGSGKRFTATRECYVTAAEIMSAAKMTVSNNHELDMAIQSAGVGDVITVDTSFPLTGAMNVPAGKNITIKGSNNTITLTASAGARHFTIQNGAAVTFGDIILDGGAGGGGIDNFGTLTIGGNAIIQQCGNPAWKGGGIYNCGNGTVTVGYGGAVGNNIAAAGGGIYNCADGIIVVSHGGPVSGNVADSGGGIYNEGGTVNVNGPVSGNIAHTGDGGGIHNAGGAVNINSGGIVSGNTAYKGYGGGVFTHDGMVAVNSGGTVSGNIASDGGAIYHNTTGSDQKVCIKYGSRVSGGIAANGYGYLYYEVIFGTAGANGALGASVAGSPIRSGDDILHNSDVTFTAVPNGGYAVKQWSVTQWSDDGPAAVSADNPYTLSNLQNPVRVQVEFEASGLLPVTNTGGEETVAYAGTAIDLSILSNLFAVDTNAGARIYSVETSGAPTGNGSIGSDGKTLTVTKAGIFTIGLVTAATATHEAGAKITATLTVNKGFQSAPTGLGKTDASANGAGDGKITGLMADTAYEYAKDSGGYTAATSDAYGEIGGLAAGSYTVRLAANDLYDASPDSAAVVISQPAAPAKTVSVGAQVGALTAGTAGAAAFTVTTENFGSGVYTVTLTGVPAGVTAADIVITDNSGTLLLSTAAATPAGTYPLTITIGKTTSNSFNLVVDTAPTYAVSVISTGTEAIGSGNYEAGIIVNISAGTPPAGMQFKDWTADPAVTFTAGTSAADSDASFIMPAQAVTMTANFAVIPVTVTDVTVIPSGVTVEKGATFQFNAIVTGSNNPSQSVTWSVDSTAGSTISTSGLLSVAADETAAKLTVAATSTADINQSGTAVVTVPQPSQMIFMISFDANGGGVFPVAMQTGIDGKLSGLPMPVRGNYAFEGWFTAVRGGSAVTANTVFTADTTLYAHWTYTGGNGGGSSGGSGNSGSETAAGIPAPVIAWLESEPADSLAGSARRQNQDYVRTRAAGAYGVRALALKTLSGLRFEHDTMADGEIQLRLYIDDPENITKDVMVSGYVKGPQVEWTAAHFKKWFKNPLHVIHMDQQTDWEQPVKIAARVDLTGMDTKKLCFYSYDKKTNSCRRILIPACRMNEDGLLCFTTSYAGDIIFSEGPLELFFQ